MPPTGSRFYAGIDPSLRSTGLVIIGRNGPEIYRIQPKKLTGAPRLQYIRDYVRDTVHGCDHACIEDASFYSVNRAEDLGQVRGVLLVLLADMQIPVTLIAPKRLKKFATGTGDADKAKMIQTANTHWGLAISNDDEADALWLAQLAYSLQEPKAIKLRRFQLEVIHGIRNTLNVEDKVSETRKPNI